MAPLQRLLTEAPNILPPLGVGVRGSHRSPRMSTVRKSNLKRVPCFPSMRNAIFDFAARKTRDHWRRLVDESCSPSPEFPSEFPRRSIQRSDAALITSQKPPAQKTASQSSTKSGNAEKSGRKSIFPDQESPCVGSRANRSPIYLK